MSDYRLNSVLGRKDGNAYEALWNWAQKNPLNKTQVVDGYKEYIKPLLSAGFKANL